MPHTEYADAPDDLTVSPTQNAGRILLGSAMMFAGVSHLTFARRGFQAQVPASLPIDDDVVVLASGVVEIALGGALVFLPRFRVQLGWLLGGFFTAIFPGNISQYLKRDGHLGLDTDQKRLVRLFGQPLLVAWALWSTGAWAVVKK